MNYRTFIMSYWPIPTFFLIFPILLIWLLYLFSDANLNLSIAGSIIAIIYSLILSVEYALRLNNEVAEETLTRYPDQFSTIRSLSTNLITVVGIFISLLGSGAFFGDTEINSLIIVAFASLVFALIIGFLALAEISGAVKEQEDGKILVGSKEWGSIWFSARYQLLLFIFSLITLISGIEL